MPPRLPVALSVPGGEERLGIVWFPTWVCERRPAFAWLAHPASITLRLPVRLADLHKTLDSCAPVELDDSWYRVRHPAGQLLRSFQALRLELDGHDDSAVADRLFHVRRFARRYWPGCFDDMIELLSQLPSGNRRQHILDAALANAGAVLVGLACFRIRAWLVENRKRRRLFGTLDVLMYYAQGLVPLDTLRQRCKDPWWNDLANDIEVCRENLTGLTPAIPETAATMRQVEGLREHLGAFLRSVVDPSDGEAQGSLSDIGQRLAGDLSLIDRHAEAGRRALARALQSHP